MKTSTGSARTGGSVDTVPPATVRPEPVEGQSFPDWPYHHLNALPRELWRWAVVCSSGPATRRVLQAVNPAARALGLQVMVGCMVGSSLAMAPAVLVAQGAAFSDLDGPLLLSQDRPHPLQYDEAGVHPSTAQLWG